MQLRGALKNKRWKERRRAQARTDMQAMLADGTVRRAVPAGTWWVQWIRGEDEIKSRLDAGWTFAQSVTCHHNLYAVLMRAPEGWSP